MIKVEQLGKKFRNEWAIRDIEMEINEGEIVGLVGHCRSLLFIIGVITFTGIPLGVYLNSGFSPLLLLAVLVALSGVGLIFYFGINLPSQQAITYLERREI